MVILITGASHTGKTLLAQKILETYGYSYVSLDLLKMGLIRSGYTQLTPEDDDALQDYLWPIVREMVKTAIENRQDLVVEGGYIPFDWEEDFSDEYLTEIRYYCLVMTRRYIETHFDAIKAFANVIETRRHDQWYTKARAIEENLDVLERCERYGCAYVLIDDRYQTDSVLADIARRSP